MVMSNKGGVGKSTISANLADELSNQGYKVGLLDIDLHGPSQAKIFNVKGKFTTNSEGRVIPFQPKENLKLISVTGILEKDDQPVIWRGPMKIVVIMQFLKDVEWGELDYLIIDAPPGTGDEPLTIAQMLPGLDGIVIVTTPQDLAVLDCKKAIRFAELFNTKIIGLVENMAILQCPHCGKQIDLFKSKDEQHLKIEYGIELLGELPFEPALLHSMDCSGSFMSQHKGTVAANNFTLIVNKIKEALG
ncbi:MAG: hypothetical protein A2103_02345 [Gammaproteobacteria bacterium GWF2_41_13]|nr:MAG: hypothetical protein A2103_02345 [Gammaproteobacteria bacterium GWF2_41_13]